MKEFRVTISFFKPLESQLLFKERFSKFCMSPKVFLLPFSSHFLYRQPNSSYLLSLSFYSFSILAILLWILPKLLQFQSFNINVNLLNFSLSTKVHLPCTTPCLQSSSTNPLKSLFSNQQSRVLKGLGPQSNWFTFNKIRQWSDKFLSNTYCEFLV